MLTQISWTSKVSVPSMFIIQDAQFSHNLTLVSVLSHVMSLLKVTFTGLLASHFWRMASQCRYLFLYPFCVWMWQSIIARAVCVVVVVLWLLCMYVCMKQTTYGRLSHWFNTTVSTHRCVEYSAETGHVMFYNQIMDLEVNPGSFILGELLKIHKQNLH